MYLQREFDIQNPGFEIAGGKGDPLFSNDNSFYISNIQKCSVAHGRLKYEFFRFFLVGFHSKLLILSFYLG